MKMVLAGVWSNGALYGPGAMEDQTLVFRSDGTGWYNWSGLGFSNVKMFTWTVDDNQQLHLSFQQKLKRDYDTREWSGTEYQEEIELPFCVEEVQTPLYGVLPFLKISFGFMVEGYALVNRESDSLPIPGSAS